MWLPSGNLNIEPNTADAEFPSSLVLNWLMMFVSTGQLIKQIHSYITIYWRRTSTRNSPPFINQRNTSILLVKRKTIGHANSVRPIRLRQLSFDRVLSAIDRFADSLIVFQELQNDMGVLVACLAGFAAGDDVEFVVGQLKGFVDANGNLDGTLFVALKQQIN